MSGAGTAAAEHVAATPARDRRKAKAAAAWRRRGLVLLFLSPWLIGFSIFIGIPLLVTVGLSFTRYNLLGDPTWVGLANYERMFTTDRQLWPAIGNTLWFVAIAVPLRVAFALGIATHGRAGPSRLGHLPDDLLPPGARASGRGHARVRVPAESRRPDPSTPCLQQVGIEGPLWFQSPDSSKISLSILAVWGLGTAMVIFLAAVLDVPRHLHESAALDGAGRWQRFRWVTLPSISPVVLFIIVIGVIEGLQYFTQAYIAATVAAGQASQAGDSNTLELGYPQGSTLFYPILLYQNGFKNFQMGYASAMAIVLMIVAFVLTVLIVRNSRRWVHYGGMR